MSSLHVVNAMTVMNCRKGNQFQQQMQLLLKFSMNNKTDEGMGNATKKALQTVSARPFFIDSLRSKT